MPSSGATSFLASIAAVSFMAVYFAVAPFVFVVAPLVLFLTPNSCFFYN